jgi:hypothetical protein
MSVQETEVLDVPWWYAVRDYETPEAAKRDFDRMNEIAAKEKGWAQIAGYRIFDAMPSDGGVPRRVVVLGAVEEKVRSAADTLEGTPIELDAEIVHGLIARRIRWLANARSFGVKPGHYSYTDKKILHDDGSVTPLASDEEPGHD